MPRRGFLNRQVRLAHTIGMLSAAGNAADAVAILQDHARVIAAADGVTIIRRDGDEVIYVSEDAISPLWNNQRFPITICVGGLAMLAGMPILIPDIRNDARVPLHAYLSTFVERMAIFPIGHQAAIGAYWRDTGPIDPETVDLMTQLATAATPPVRSPGIDDQTGRLAAGRKRRIRNKRAAP